MKLLSPQQIHDWDAFTIQHEPVSSIDLMERAAGKCTDFIINKEWTNFSFKIFCGKGNNGGDGLAIARQLIEAGSSVTIYILEFGSKGTDDFQLNLSRLHALTTNIHFVQSPFFLPEISENDILIDALFGSGLSRPLTDLNAQVVQHINESAANKIAIDVPSGMYIDKSSKGNTIVKANFTLTFQTAKLCFLVPENADYIGEVIILDIGLLAQYLETTESAFQVIDASTIHQIYKPRKRFAHKGNFGHALLFAGNEGKMGAAILAAKACLRSGVGLLTLNVPAEFLNVVHAAIPEAMCQIRQQELDISKFTTVGVGPGINTDEASALMLLQLLDNFKRPVVLDADALNIISKQPELLSKVAPDSIFTPHPKEFERLFGESNNDFERIHLALQLSKKHNIIIVLKGHHTLVAVNGEGWFNATGNSGLAKGGSGDVLTGIITALLAQGYNSKNAAILGVHLHGMAADIALAQQSQESLLASDVIYNIGAAFKKLQAYL